MSSSSIIGDITEVVRLVILNDFSMHDLRAVRIAEEHVQGIGVASIQIDGLVTTNRDHAKTRERLVRTLLVPSLEVPAVNRGSFGLI